MNQVSRGRKEPDRCATVVVGVGNILLKDEGIGVHVVRALSDAIGHSRPDVQVVDGGTSPDALLLPDGVRKLVLIDATKAGGPPGSVYRFRPGDIPSNGPHATSLHQMSLQDSLRTMRLSGREPGEIVIIGVEPEEIDWGLDLTPRLKKELPRIVKLVMDELTA